jgi:hypothetical protein
MKKIQDLPHMFPVQKLVDNKVSGFSDVRASFFTGLFNFIIRMAIPGKNNDIPGNHVHSAKFNFEMNW